MRVSRPRVMTLIGWAVLLTPVVLVFLSPATVIQWVGSTDLEIVFAVTDAETDLPIAEATVRVFSESGPIDDDGDRREMTLTTDDAGTASYLRKGCLCSGKKGWLVDTYSVRLPGWYFFVRAPGYERSDVTWLPDTRQRAERGNPAKVLIPVRLKPPPPVSAG